MAERLFRVLSLAFLTVGMVVGVAGASKDSDENIANISELVQDMNMIIIGIVYNHYHQLVKV